MGKATDIQLCEHSSKNSILAEEQFGLELNQQQTTPHIS